MVRAFAGVVPPVVMTSSWLAPDVVMPNAPEIVEAPALLSCRIPPSAVALVDVMVRVPPSVRLFPPTMRTVFAAVAPPDPVDHEAMDALKSEVTRQTRELNALQTKLAEIRSEQSSAATELAQQNRALERVEGAISTLPDSLKPSSRSRSDWKYCRRL